jgi:outer membrane murein-binding lipoprotein Lpp
MNAKEEFINSKEPATKGDLEQLREDLQADMVNMEGRIISRMDERFESVEQNFKHMNQKFEALLAVVEDTNVKVSRLAQDMEGLPERVTALEDDNLKIKVKIGM